MDIRTALEKNPNGLTRGQLLTITGKDFKSIKMALSRLPTEEHDGRYYLVLNPKHREQLRASFGDKPSESTELKIPEQVLPSNPEPLQEPDELSVLPDDALEDLILAEPTWTPDMEAELLSNSELVAAVLAGEPLQVLRTDGRWINFKYGSMTLSDIAQTTRKIRKARPTATICNVQINLGEALPLKAGTNYYTPCIDNAQLFSVHEWNGSPDDLMRLNRHIVHLKPIDAQRHAAVLIGYTNRCAIHLPNGSETM